MIFLASCSPQELPSICQQKVAKRDTVINIGKEKSDNSLNVQYLGCGGLLLEKGGTKLLLDPFFSNPRPFLSLATKKISSDDSTINKAFKFIDYEGVNQLLITHAHYDHLMDVPSIVRNFYQGKIPIMASNTANNMLRSEGVAPENLTSVDANAARGTVAGKWFNVSTNCRVMPVIYEHAPHYKLFGIIPISLYKGFYNTEPKNLESAKDWKEGQTMGYLVDFLAGDTVQLRVYLLAGGGANPNVGYINQIPSLKDKKIDLMVLCVASFEYVKKYPQSILTTHRPKYVLGAHWEDFFTEYFPKTGNRKSVRLTNVLKFYKRMKCIDYGDKWNMAEPLVKMKFEF